MTHKSKSDLNLQHPSKGFGNTLNENFSVTGDVCLSLSSIVPH